LTGALVEAPAWWRIGVMAYRRDGMMGHDRVDRFDSDSDPDFDFDI
jgi:hypothetical protein